MKKRGLSPVIATVLLVALALVLALIIFLWARTFIGELVEKSGSRIENSCEAVDFLAEAFESDGSISIENTGSIPLFGMEIREKKLIGGDVRDVAKFNNIITAGGTVILPNIIPSDLKAGDKIILVPILLGETDTELKAHTCDKDFGLTVEIQ